jgi:hypothetical protein
MADVDELIIELVESGRKATEEELARIVKQVAQAPLASRTIRPPRWWREALIRRGEAAPTRVSAAEFHLRRRIDVEEQWPAGTTLAQYESDLRRVCVHLSARVWTYEYFSEPCVGILAPSHVQGPPGARPFLFVAYSALYGRLSTGYQARGPEAIFDESYQNLTQHR